MLYNVRIGNLNDDNLSELDKLILEAEKLCLAQGINACQISEKDIETGEKLLKKIALILFN